MSHNTSARLFSRVKGHGPTLVLVHGLFGSMENLGGIARLLAEQFKVYSVDLPNHGRSPHSGPMTLASMADALADWALQQNITQAYWLGHSLGGKAVMELALRNPKLCQKLVVLDIAPVTYQPRHNGVFTGLEAVELPTLISRKQADQRMLPHVPELAVRSFLLKNLVKMDRGFAWRMNVDTIRHHYPDLIVENAEGKASYDNEVLFVKGGDSDYLQESHRDAIAKRFPKASLHVIAGTGHWLHAEKPEAVFRIVSRFLSNN